MNLCCALLITILFCLFYGDFVQAFPRLCHDFLEGNDQQDKIDGAAITSTHIFLVIHHEMYRLPVSALSNQTTKKKLLLNEADSQFEKVNLIDKFGRHLHVRNMFVVSRPDIEYRCFVDEEFRLNCYNNQSDIRINKDNFASSEHEFMWLDAFNAGYKVMFNSNDRSEMIFNKGKLNFSPEGEISFKTEKQYKLYRSGTAYWLFVLIESSKSPGDFAGRTVKYTQDGKPMEYVVELNKLILDNSIKPLNGFFVNRSAIAFDPMLNFVFTFGLNYELNDDIMVAPMTFQAPDQFFVCDMTAFDDRKYQLKIRFAMTVFAMIFLFFIIGIFNKALTTKLKRSTNLVVSDEKRRANSAGGQKDRSSDGSSSSMTPPTKTDTKSMHPSSSARSNTLDQIGVKISSKEDTSKPKKGNKSSTLPGTSLSKSGSRVVSPKLSSSKTK